MKLKLRVSVTVTSLVRIASLLTLIRLVGYVDKTDQKITRKRIEAYEWVRI